MVKQRVRRLQEVLTASTQVLWKLQLMCNFERKPGPVTCTESGYNPFATAQMSSMLRWELPHLAYLGDCRICRLPQMASGSQHQEARL